METQLFCPPPGENALIAEAIELVGGTQQSLADCVGVSQPTVSKWLRGGGLSLEAAVRIEDCTRGRVRARDLISPSRQCGDVDLF